MKRKNSKWLIVGVAGLLLCSGCGNREEEPVIQESISASADSQSADTSTVKDAPEASAADDTWYKSGSVYVDENGHKLEVFYDDEGALQFAVDGLSLYNTMANDFQTENDWRIYTCDDGTTVIYYPGTPAHLEISDGEYAGIYEADDGK